MTVAGILRMIFFSLCTMTKNSGLQSRFCTDLRKETGDNSAALAGEECKSEEKLAEIRAFAKAL